MRPAEKLNPVENAKPVGPGTLVGVVGASGVGKDALLRGAQEALQPCFAGQVLFPRRVITRPAGPGEDHVPCTPAAFDRISEEDGFAISWQAHGLDYGIPVSIDHDLREGRSVVLNLSRSVLCELGRKYENFVTVRVVVSANVQAARLAQRGREDLAEITRRLNREDPAPQFHTDYEIRNDAGVAEGVQALAQILKSVGS